MTNFVLIHGAWHGGWAWHATTAYLRSRGHHATAPTLPSAPGATLEDHVVAVEKSILSAPEPVVVVAHSYAGVVAPQAVARHPDRVLAIILVDGWITHLGQSMMDVMPDWFAAYCRSTVQGEGSKAVLAPPPAAGLGLSDERLTAMLDERMTAQPLATFTDPATTALDTPRVARHAITCLPSSFPFTEMALAAGYAVHPIESDHEVMLSHPDAFTEMLETISQEE
jgi:pimeloyl-ACP methyl ester carboxylesterase